MILRNLDHGFFLIFRSVFWPAPDLKSDENSTFGDHNRFFSANNIDL